MIGINIRVQALRKVMESHQADAFLVTRAENVFYLSGFTGGRDGKLLIQPDHCYLITDARYTEQSRQQCPGWELIEIKPAASEPWEEICHAVDRLAVEAHDLSYLEFLNLQEKLSVNLVPLKGAIEELRMVKDEAELDKMRHSARIGDQVFLHICEFITAGKKERQIAAMIAYLLREQGCDKEAFDTIALAGENTAMPHGQPGDRLLSGGDMLTLDYGGFFQSYAGDMTRTLIIGEASVQFQDMYKVLLEAQQLGVSMVRAGIGCRELDGIVRGCLHKYDLDKYFRHGTGHSLGLEIHEQPSISTRSTGVLLENMVITIEPGIYIPGWGGIRIEDTVIVKNQGCEVITRTDKNLLIL